MIAEDEPQLLRLYRIVLEDVGIEVVTCNDGEECLDAFRKSLDENSSRFDLIILDHRMPKKNGLQVAREVAAMNPSQNMLMITAFAGLLDLKDGPPNMKIIEKPFDIMDLGLIVKEFQ